MYPFARSTTRLAAALLCTLPALAQPADELMVRWRKGLHPLSELTQASPEIPTSVADQLMIYTSWVTENDYAMALSEDARVLLIARNDRTVRGRLKLVEEALEAFDERLAPPARDLEGEHFVQASFGVGDHRPDERPVVLIEVFQEPQYGSLLAGLGQARPDQASWLAQQREKHGFVGDHLHAGAWLAAPDGIELGDVWRPENEMVNRLARLLLFRSYGPLPTWLRVGAAWSIEQEVLGSLYSFPYRYQFVGIGEHSGWKNELKRAFKRRKGEPLRMEEFADWRRGTWDDEEAALAWGVADALVRKHEGLLPQLAEALRKHYKENWRETLRTATGAHAPDYQVPADEQLELLESLAGGDVLVELSELFRKGR